MEKLIKNLILVYIVLFFNVNLSKAQTEEPITVAGHNFKSGINKLQAFEIISKHLIIKTLEGSKDAITTKQEVETLLGQPNEKIGERIFKFEINQNGCSLYLIFDEQKLLESFTLKNCN